MPRRHEAARTCRCVTYSPRGYPPSEIPADVARYSQDRAVAGLAFFPKTGHVLNLEEPNLFNRFCADFFHQVERGSWPARDPCAKPLLG